MSYIELHAASAFSFLEGASLPEVLVDRAAELGYPAIALLDRDGVYGIPRFHKAALAAGITPIVGAELTMHLAPGPHAAPRTQHQHPAPSTQHSASGPQHAARTQHLAPSTEHAHVARSTQHVAHGGGTWRLPVLVE